MAKHTDKYVSAAAVLRRLADMEQEGVDFYEGLSSGASTAWLRAFAGKLVSAEQRHRRRFLEYARRAEEGAPEENQLEGDLPRDAVRLLGTRLLPSKATIARSAAYATDEDALKLAIRAEENTALLLEQLRSYVPKVQRRYIDRVIKEEWGHKEKLEELLKRKLK
ncbi:MAG: hypothetical protein JXR94_19805 [Candidatus Hydrogenedentes bacterium]|nr:hypothetical protein [Candidatus Hydrogenedentota bacterium]